MPEAKAVSNIEREFVLSLLTQAEKPQRVDGRKLLDSRQPTITFGESLGHVELSWGSTRIIVRVSAELTKPYDDRPYEGVFLISTDISSMASPAFENNRQSDEEVLVSRLVEKAIRRSNALDLESLCVVAGKSCWMIRADVHYLNYDGGFVDATCFGVITALLHYRRPDTSIDGDKVIVHPVEERVPIPLSILHVPLCCTFSFINEGSIVLLDSTAQEELLQEAKMTVTINKNREVCQIQKPGGSPVDAIEIMNCINLAYTQVVKWTELIHQRVKEDDVERNRGNIVNLLAENERK